MGKLNDELCRFINRPNVFAELFNVGVYGGQKVIMEENLADVQHTYGEDMSDRYGKKRRKIRERDVVKALWMNGSYALLAVENQANLNYCMPLRCLEYDVEDLAKQLRRIQRNHKKEKDLRSGAEYLSGIRKTDRLMPSITVLLYHGAGKWDAAEQLQDMIDMTALDEKLKAMYMNYKLHIINLTELDENLFETELRELIGIMKRVNDKKQMEQYLKENVKRLQNMDDEVYDLICTMAGIKELTAKTENCRSEDRKERMDMCKAWEDMKADSREDGRREGRKEGEERLGALISRLYKDGRGDEVLKAASSVRFRNRLYREYDMIS